jgi:DNA-binding IclR family transcriptional regulator
VRVLTENKLNNLKTGSLYRASILIEAIARGSRKGSLLTELVSKTQLPRATIHRVLNMLMSMGWIEKNEATSRFNLGQDLAALGYSAIIRHPLERIAALELTPLAEALNQVLYLNVRSGLDTVCIGRYESQSQIIVGKGWVGMRGPLGMSPSCMGMFIKMPEDEVDEIIEANMSRYYRIEGFDERGFRASLNASKTNGYGTYNSIILDKTMSGLGVAILSPKGYPIASIGTTFITEWLTEDLKQTTITQLQKVASSISKAYFRKVGCEK